MAAPLIGWWASAQGGENWGLQWLLLIPIGLLLVLAVAPAVCAWALRRGRHDRAAATGGWAAAVGAGMLVLALLSAALGYWWLAPVELLATPVMARAIASGGRRGSV